MNKGTCTYLSQCSTLMDVPLLSVPITDTSAVHWDYLLRMQGLFDIITHDSTARYALHVKSFSKTCMLCSRPLSSGALIYSLSDLAMLFIIALYTLIRAHAIRYLISTPGRKAPSCRTLYQLLSLIFRVG